MRSKKQDLELVRIEKEYYNRETGRRIRRIYEKPRHEPLGVRVKRGAAMLTGAIAVVIGVASLI